MARNLTPAMIAAVQAGTVAPFLITKINTAGGDVRVWNGKGDLPFDDGSGSGTETYIGVGTYGGISAVQESADMKANGITLSLSGIPSSMISTVLGEIEQGRKASIWLGFFDASTNAVIADPYELFSGQTDIPEIVESGDTSTVSISIENRLIDLEKKRVRRYTKEDQQRDFPADQGFDFVPSLQDKDIQFGTS